MTLVANINTLESQKFTESVDGKVSVRVMPLGVLVPAQFDTIEASYPTATTDVFVYKAVGLTVATVTITYTDATKDTIQTVVRS